MHPGIITADISDHFPIFLISKDLMLDSSKKPIHITKREINDISLAYFKNLLSIVDWKHAILQLVNQITEASSQGKYTLGIFLDLSKAFDTVNHNILLEKLKAYGIQSENLKWFRSHLSNRKQFTLSDDFKTEVKIVKCGVRQGSILGPLLFLIFVNDLSNSTKVLDPVLFADDTNLFCSDSNIRTLFETTNQELSQINDWFLANKLSLNVEKIKYMLFHKCIEQENIPLKLPLLQLNSNIIEKENSLKFLGVILDEHLTWKKHTQVSKNVGVLYKASKLINFYIYIWFFVCLLRKQTS